MTGYTPLCYGTVSTHMPLTRHDVEAYGKYFEVEGVSTHMPLTRHDIFALSASSSWMGFYSHASYEA